MVSGDSGLAVNERGRVEILRTLGAVRSYMYMKI